MQNEIRNPFRTIAATIIGIGLYWVGLHLPILQLNDDFRGAGINSSSEYSSFFALGIVSVSSCFFLVELGSFFIPPLKKWRNGGAHGRKYLNVTSFIIAFLVAIFHAYSIAGILKDTTTWGWLPAMISSETSLLQISGFYLTGLAALIFLGHWMTKHGLGNGFAVIILVGVLMNIRDFVFTILHDFQSPEFKLNYVGILFLAFLIFFLVKFLRFQQNKSADLLVEGQSLGYRLPPLPQGIFTLENVFSFLVLPQSIITLTKWQLPTLQQYTWSFAIVAMGLYPLLSLFSYYIAYSPIRIQNNVPNVTLPENFKQASKNNFIISTLILTVMLFVTLMPQPFVNEASFIFPLITLVQFFLIYFIGKDMLEHYRFLNTAKEVTHIGTLDNIHFATVARSKLEKAGVEFHIQGFEFRRMYAFFTPLFKMRVLVKKGQEERAREILALDTVKII